ncbi:MAG: murein biosynthesis integral membrane protein MurJ [Elusimicrobia bacterium]|nr:murein biosynthesis integral membrane protein MurJ [Elusimicrobiota bacterium]
MIEEKNNSTDPAEIHHDVISKASSVSLATLVSRVLGYVRDMLIANLFGATMAADAFFVAYRIPNLLRRLLGEGSLSTSFIPVYTEYLTNRGEDESRRLVRVTLGTFGVLFVLLTFLGILFAPLIVRLIAIGYTQDPSKFALTVYLTRIMFPFLMLIGLGAIMLGVLNSLRMFLVPALAPVMLSISEIAFILFVCPFLDLPVSGLAVGVVVGGLLQLLYQMVPAAVKVRNIMPVIDFGHPGLRKIGRLMLPAVLGLSIMQINSFVDTICATLLGAGSVTHLYYGNRLMQLPLALFGTAIATVALPMMSENAARNEMGRLKDTFSFSMRAVSFLIMPTTVSLIVFGRPIMELLFERGLFLPSDTASAAWVLSFYASGLMFYAGVKIAASAFYSLQDTKTPVITASIAMVLNIALNIIVVKVPGVRETFSVGGLALATALSSAVNFVLLVIVFRLRNGAIGATGILSSLGKHAAASAALGFFLYYSSLLTAGWSKYARVPLVVVLGAALYMAVSHILRVRELGELKKIRP